MVVVAKEIVDCMYNFSTRNLFLAIFIFATSFSCQSISPEKNLRRWTTVELEDMKKKPKTSCYDADFLTHNRMCLLLLCVCADAVVLQRENYSSKEKNTYQNLMICYRLQPFITTHFSLSCFSNFATSSATASCLSLNADLEKQKLFFGPSFISELIIHDSKVRNVH